MRRIHCYADTQGRTESGLSLTEVKKRIRRQGGSGYTQHFDRDGSFQETTPITLGDNARTTYRAEYNTSRKFRTEAEPRQTTATALDVRAILDRTIQKAKEARIGQDDDDRLMDILGSMLGDKAERITEDWYDNVLCHIHGCLFHEWRGFGHYGRRREAIRRWKEKNGKQPPVPHKTILL